MKHCILLIVTTIISLIGNGQEYDLDYFRSPLDIPLFLSGNFGELRSNHFHAGIDIKTEGVEGKKVYATADGYISRIKISPFGYGKAIYINHPNGITTVYGHLKKFSERIEKIVQEEQYRREAFSIQMFPAPFKVPVKKGEIIAYSGNTGGSGGPHLHFETRYTKSEHPTNPLFFGFDVKDSRAPEIRAINIYPLNDTSLVDGKNKPKRFQATYQNGQYRLITRNSIRLHGLLGFGIESIDRMNGTSNTYGLHNIQLKMDDQLIFEQEMKEYAFHEDRYLNSLIDYETYIRRKRRVQKSFVEDGNYLSIYKHAKNKGEILFNDGQSHSLQYILKDLKDNSASIQFQVQSDKIKAESISQVREKVVKYFPYNQKNTYTDKNIIIDLPKGVLYKDLYFKFHIGDTLNNTISPLYQIHDHYTPLHRYINVAIKMPDIDPRLKSKALIVSTIDGKSFYPEGGKWNGDNLGVKTRSFGGYAVAIDSISPKIKPINIYPGVNMSGKWTISLKITDNLSGIASYRATVDNKWILMEYDAKKDLLFYSFDERVGKGKHDFRIVVTDKVGNKKEYQASFNR